MSPRPLAVIDIVGLTPALLGPHTPCLNALIDDGFMATMAGVIPAVTCSAQASMLTGRPPRDHGIVGNGWYFHDLAEVRFWHQSNHLVAGDKVWDMARRQWSGFTCAQLFWWFNMYARVDWSVTPRPIYPADGRKIPALYSHPAELHASLENELGPFPFFEFWGPRAGLPSSQWIADCSRRVYDRHRPTLTLVYLPHLDYNLQRLGPSDPAIARDVRDIDRIAGELIDHFRGRGCDIMVVSEYGIDAVDTPIAINRILREAGLLSVRETLGFELLDAGASRAFAVADHEIAHVYIAEPEDRPRVAALLKRVAGIDRLLDREDQRTIAIDHARSGDLVAIASPGCWFSYYYWLEDARAPDFACTVDIHRKPGYDPVELFLDPAIRFPRAKVAWRLMQKALGMRMLMDVIPLRPDLVRGSHGRPCMDPAQGPVLISSRKDLERPAVAMTDVCQLILEHHA